jgi:hypothetical protein
LQFKASLGKWFTRPYLEKPYRIKFGLVEWFKVKAFSSSPSAAKKKKKMNVVTWMNSVCIWAQMWLWDEEGFSEETSCSRGCICEVLTN